MKKYIILLGIISLAAVLYFSCGKGRYTDADYQYPICLADPFVMLRQDTYYLYGTGNKDGIEVYVSDDMIHWNMHPQLALHKDNSYADQHFWAPEVYCLGGKFFMYYSADRHICVATSDSPLGPFVQQEKRPQLTGEESVDNSLFIDDDGTPYMYFDRFNDGLNIWVAELERDYKTIKTSTLAKCINVSQPWEDVWPRVNDGAYVVKHKGRYYMIYSANGYESPHCGIGFAMAPTPAGPWTKYTNNPVYQRPYDLVGVGHGSIFRDKEGKMRIAFHAHFDKDNIRPRLMYLADVWFTDDPVPVLKIGGEVLRPKTDTDVKLLR